MRGVHMAVTIVLTCMNRISHLGTRTDTHGCCWQVAHGIRRVNVGGKLLTNYLKEVISYRAWNMMDETYLVNEVSNLG